MGIIDQLIEDLVFKDSVERCLDTLIKTSSGPSFETVKEFSNQNSASLYSSIVKYKDTGHFAHRVASHRIYLKREHDSMMRKLPLGHLFYEVVVIPSRGKSFFADSNHYRRNNHVIMGIGTIFDSFFSAHSLSLQRFVDESLQFKQHKRYFLYHYDFNTKKLDREREDLKDSLDGNIKVSPDLGSSWKSLLKEPFFGDFKKKILKTPLKLGELKIPEKYKELLANDPEIKNVIDKGLEKDWKFVTTLPISWYPEYLNEDFLGRMRKGLLRGYLLGGLSDELKRAVFEDEEFLVEYLSRNWGRASRHLPPEIKKRFSKRVDWAKQLILEDWRKNKIIPYNLSLILSKDNEVIKHLEDLIFTKHRGFSSVFKESAKPISEVFTNALLSKPENIKKILLDDPTFKPDDDYLTPVYQDQDFIQKLKNKVLGLEEDSYLTLRDIPTFLLKDDSFVDEVIKRSSEEYSNYSDIYEEVIPHLGNLPKNLILGLIEEFQIWGSTKKYWLEDSDWRGRELDYAGEALIEILLADKDFLKDYTQYLRIDENTNPKIKDILLRNKDFLRYYESRLQGWGHQDEDLIKALVANRELTLDSIDKWKNLDGLPEFMLLDVFLMSKALIENWEVLEKLPLELQDKFQQEDFLREMISKNWNIVKKLKPEMAKKFEEDRDFMLESLSNYPDPIKGLPDNLSLDKKFLAEIAFKNEDALAFVKRKILNEMLDDPEMLKQAEKVSVNKYSYALLSSKKLDDVIKERLKQADTKDYKIMVTKFQMARALRSLAEGNLEKFTRSVIDNIDPLQAQQNLVANGYIRKLDTDDRESFLDDLFENPSYNKNLNLEKEEPSDKDLQFLLSNRTKENSHKMRRFKILNKFRVSGLDSDIAFEEFKKEHPDTVEEPLFHGTGYLGATFILRTGFKTSGSILQKAGKAMGSGIYLTPFMDKSLQYAHDNPGTTRGSVKGFIFVCKAIKGSDKDHKWDKGRFKTPEIVIRNPEKQIKILYVYEVERLEKS